MSEFDSEFDPTTFDPVAYINEPRWLASRYGLERITELLNRMGRPQDRLKFVHVAGTNGKGSVCSYVASVLQEAGYRTGLFTSPYIMTFEERIRVDGQNIPREDLIDVTLFVREHAEAMESEFGEHPTEFELMTAIAFEHFARSGCDIVVCEVGMGGALDSTNVIESPEACVIVRIGLDHTEYLGSTMEEIARTKSGIIKEGADVVSYPQDDEAALEAIRSAAHEHDCSFTVSDLDALHTQPVNEEGVRPFSYRGRKFTTRLLGSYQPCNAAVAIDVLGVLRKRGWEISDEALHRGIAETVWPARFEVVQAEPGKSPIIVDGGHNPQGAAVLAESLADVFPGRPVVFIMSVLADKEYREMIKTVLPLAAVFSCSTPPNPRALSAEDLARVIEELGGTAIACESFPEAVAKARALAEDIPDSAICAFGSLYSVRSLKEALG